MLLVAGAHACGGIDAVRHVVVRNHDDALDAATRRLLRRVRSLELVKRKIDGLQPHVLLICGVFSYR